MMGISATAQRVKMTPVKQVPEQGQVISKQGSSIAKTTAINVTNQKQAPIGDLGIFDLKGPVKSFTLKNEWGSVTRTFDRKGLWLTIDGKPLRQVYTKGIRRDNNGRFVKGIMDEDGNGEEYYYNSDGRITKRNYHFYDTTEENTYTYDSKGNLIKMDVVEGGMDASEPYTEEYVIQTTDKYGNWTERVTKIGSEKSIVTRTIVYYE